MTDRIVVNQPPSQCKTISPTRNISFRIVVDTTAFTAALEKAGRQFAEFANRVLANPIARAAFERSRKQPSPIRGGHGAAYRARSRRRTRSHR